MITKDDLYVTVPKSASANYKLTAQYNEPLQAPIKQGQEIGKLTIKVPQGEPIVVPLYAERDIKRLGFFSGALIKLMMMLGGGS